VYGTLANTQILACVTVTQGVSPQDAELNMFLEKARQFINQELGLNADLAEPAAIIGTVAEYYASGLYLSKNNMPEGQTTHPNVSYAEKLLWKYKAPDKLIFVSKREKHCRRLSC
jgi:hypothetical protein